MSKSKYNKQEIGMAPDELLFRGEVKNEVVRLDLMAYNGVELEEKQIKNVEEVMELIGTESVAWLNIIGLHNTELMEEVAKEYAIDKMLLAEVMNTASRPKVTEFEDGMFVSIKMLSQEGINGKIISENISLIANTNFLISFQEVEGDVFDPIRERIRKGKKKIRQSGADYLAFSLLDAVLDNYTYIISNLGEKIEALEEKLLSDPGRNVIDEVNMYKKDLNFLRRNIKPAKEMVSALSRMESEFKLETNAIYYKILMDNINHADESLDSYREILSDLLNICHTTISNKLNEVMKFLTVFSVIFIPLTFIAGLYGMNFDNMPELHHRNGYYVTLAVMLCIGVFMHFYFKRKKWL